jgi:small subunit ribosomal protein S15
MAKPAKEEIEKKTTVAKSAKKADKAAKIVKAEKPAKAVKETKVKKVAEKATKSVKEVTEVVEAPVKVAKKAKKSAKNEDTGSVSFQIENFTVKIKSLTKHLQSHIHDFDSRRGLLIMVGKRRRLLNYLKKNDIVEYEKAVKTLKLKA